jgi:hypothetical protein
VHLPRTKPGFITFSRACGHLAESKTRSPSARR